MKAHVEEPLEGGNTSDGVVRIGDTVRRPAGPWTPAVDALLRYLASVGYTGSPRSLGFDDQGRHVLEYVPGDIEPRFPHDRHGGNDSLRRVGALIRDFHDAVTGFTSPTDAKWNVAIPPDEETLIAHHDLAPWNLVLGEDRSVFIDWDTAGPGSRLWDLSYAAHGFVPLSPVLALSDASARLRSLVDGYGLDEQDRRRLAPLIVRRILAMYDLLRTGHAQGVQPWSRLWDEGHGDVWRMNGEFAEAHVDLLTRALLDAR